MLTSSIIDIERNSNSSLNIIISLGPIPCFHYVTKMLYIWKVIISKTKMSDCGWSRNGSHKWSSNSNLHPFSGCIVTHKFLFVWLISAGTFISLGILLSYILIFISLKVLNNTLIWIRLDINFIFGKCGSSLKSLILNFPNKQSGPCLEHWYNKSRGFNVCGSITALLVNSPWILFKNAYYCVYC